MATEENAIYHLGFDVDREVSGEQPVISIHTDPSNLEGISAFEDSLARIQEYLGLEKEFDFDTDTEGYGYSGAGNLVASSRVAGWTALRLAVPVFETNGGYYGGPTPRLLPVVSTMSAVLRHLNHSELLGAQDSNNPQLIVASLDNRQPLNEQYSAPVHATLMPDLLERLSLLEDIEAAEERVRRVLSHSFQFTYGYIRDDKFRVSLGEEISFDYPGDASGFFGRRDRKAETKGLRISAANNDYTVQQIAIMSGLASMNDIALELN